MSSGPLTMIKARAEMLGNMSRNKTKGKRRRCQSARAGGDSIRGWGAGRGQNAEWEHRTSPGRRVMRVAGRTKLLARDARRPQPMFLPPCRRAGSRDPNDMSAPT